MFSGTLLLISYPSVRPLVSDQWGSDSQPISWEKGQQHFGKSSNFCSGSIWYCSHHKMYGAMPRRQSKGCRASRRRSTANLRLMFYPKNRSSVLKSRKTLSDVLSLKKDWKKIKINKKRKSLLNTPPGSLLAISFETVHL